MSTELKKKRSLLREETIKTTIEIDVILDLFTNVLRKEDGEKCICSNVAEAGDDKNVFAESEIVPGLEVTINSEGKIKLAELIIKLKMAGYPLTGSMISVYSKDADEYMYIGSDPIDSSTQLDSIQFNLQLIKIRAVCYIDEKQIIRGGAQINGVRLSRTSSMVDKKKSKRTKERKIGYIIEKVNTWRKLYNGFYDEYAKFTKYSLDEAAKMIGISKKSLDDYLLQLRLGRKYGFDFNANKNSKVGVLRSFVKKKRTNKND